MTVSAYQAVSASDCSEQIYS